MAQLPPGFVLDGQPQAQGTPPPPGFQLDSQPPEATYNPTDDMGTMERLLAGIGQGMHGANQGLEQFAANNPAVMAALGLPGAGMTDPRIAQAMNAQVDESARLDAPLLDTTSGAIGSAVGEMVATAPAGMGGKFVKGGKALANTARAAGMGAQGGAAAGLVQGVENANEGGYGADKAFQIGQGAGIGAGAGAVLNRGAALLENLLPSNATATVLNLANRGANKTDLAREGEELARKTGVMLTPGQVSGSKTMNAAENAARQSIFSRELANEGDQRRIAQLAEHFNKTMDGITRSEASPAVAGAQVQSAVKRTIKGLEDWRAKTAEEDYGAIRKLTRGQASIQPKSTADLLKSVLQENEGIGTPGGDALANFARKQLSNVDPKATAYANEMAGKIGDFPISKQLTDAAKATTPAQGNLDKIMSLRSYLSKVAGGQAKISGENQDRRIAAQLLQSIDNDLESAGAEIGGDLGGMLKLANARYREVSQQIEGVRASPLGKILGEDVAGALQTGEFNTIAPETVMARLGKLKPTELGVVRGLLEKDNPQAWAVFKRGLLEDAIEKSSQMPASAGVNNAVLRPSQLVKNVGDQKRLEAAFTPSELAEINAGLNVARRLSDSTGYNFSGTAAQSEALGLMNKITAGGIKGAAHLAGGALGSRKLAQIMTDSDGRRMLLELKRLGPKSQRARELSAKLSAMFAAQPDNQPDQGG